ncbi:putative protein kinase RLK-Pelle-WAK-LRK10L-1 family [Helianthus anomalus]
MIIPVNGLIEKNFGHLKIRLSDIKLATDNFSVTNIIVDHEFYTLYRGGLSHFDKENPSSIDGKNKDKQPKRHNNVVVKHIFDRDDKQREDFFFTEIEILPSVKHPNIGTLYGFCVDDYHLIIVIESVSNGYLGHYLDNVNIMRILNWERRLKICIDIARALNYLHSNMEYQKMIINRAIKSDNIWLDANWGANIADFGLSLFLPLNQDYEALCLDVIGTPCYCDPVYMNTFMLKRESDTYSFRVVMFEILCGRRAYDPIYKKESDKGLGFEARRCFLTGTIEEMIDPILKEKTVENHLILNRGPNKDSLNTFIDIAYRCVAETQDQRPTMEVVVKELEKALCSQVSKIIYVATGIIFSLVTPLIRNGGLRVFNVVS